MSSAAQRVQLAYAHGVLEGSAGTEQVTVQITPGVVTGELGGVIVEATWHSTSSYQLAPGKAVETEATGTFVNAELHLAGRFYLGRMCSWTTRNSTRPGAASTCSLQSSSGRAASRVA